MSVGPYKTPAASGFAVYFADGSASPTRSTRNTGREIWTRKVDDHPYAHATGSPTVHNGRVYVPLAGVGEEGQGGRRATSAARSAAASRRSTPITGAVIWKSYTIAERRSRAARTTTGVQTWGPAGGGIWAAPTIDPARRVVYITTGNGYSDPAQPTTDAVLALDMDTGKLRWLFQPLPNDVWAGGCRPTNLRQPELPGERSGPITTSRCRRCWRRTERPGRLLIVQQKSGHGLRARSRQRGARCGSTAPAPAAASAASGAARRTTAGVLRRQRSAQRTGRHARRRSSTPATEVWSKPPAERLCGTARGCSAAQGAAVTAIPGIVFSGSMDGGVRAYSSDDGTIVWKFDTNKEFETVNGVKAKGGAMDGPGPVVADGMVYVNSGYVSLIGRPGNVLLAFGVD